MGKSAITNKKYLAELADLKYQMIKAEEFANYLPCFKDIILERKYCKESTSLDFGDRYKGVPFPWRIKRHSYAGRANNISNYKGECDCHLFNIYINTLSLFDSHHKFNLYDFVKEVDCFHIDRVNTTFYLQDHHIEKFLDCIVKWYNQAKDRVNEYKKAQKIKKLQDELNKLLNKVNQ